jgi:3-methylornithyl-N6-L-lysine dehydrogenase
MTRLREEQVRAIGKELEAYDAMLVKKTGRNLKEIAAQAAGISVEKMEKGLQFHRVSVVPITCGQGVLEGFTEAVRDILNHVGARVFETAATDVAGLAEAVEMGITIVFLADEERFIALDLIQKRVIDNSLATARGYVEALQCATKGLSNHKVLVIGGAGRVGRNAVQELMKRGADVSVHDPDCKRLAQGMVPGVHVEEDLKKALGRHTLLFDASPGEGLIGVEHIRPETVIAAPGIPLGLTKEAYPLVENRLIHDPLQIGVATMLSEAVRCLCRNEKGA